MSLATVLPRDPRLAILVVGLGVAAADMAVALCYWAMRGVAPERIVRGIAAGWVGRDAARAGGVEMVLLGAVSHLAIAIAMVWVYGAASRRLPALVERPLACGLAYGVATWAAMKFVVIPLSAIVPSAMPPPLSWQLVHFASHLFIVGVPSAYLARSLSHRSRGSA